MARHLSTKINALIAKTMQHGALELQAGRRLVIAPPEADGSSFESDEEGFGELAVGAILGIVEEAFEEIAPPDKD